MDELGYTTVFASLEEQRDDQNTLSIRREDGLGHLHIGSDATRAFLYAGLRTEKGEPGDQTTVGLELTPEAAREVAEALLKAANDADKAETTDRKLWNEEP